MIKIMESIDTNITIDDIKNAIYSSSFMDDRANINIDNQIYVKVNKNQWEHIPMNPHAYGGFYSDEEIYKKVLKGKKVSIY